MLYSLGLSILIVFATYCVIAWAGIAALLLSRIPDLICDLVDSLVGLWAKVFTPNASEEAVKRRGETAAALVLTLGIIVPVMGLTVMLG